MRRRDVRLAVVFKDFATWLKVSCVGLNVAGYNTAKVLKRHGVHTAVFPVRHNIDVVNAIDRYNETHDRRLTHVVISAPWLSTWDLRELIEHFSYIQFVVVCHSNVGFLMADARGVEILRQVMELEKTHANIRVAGNSKKFVKWLRLAYNERALLLPNLYPLEGRRKRCGKWVPEGHVVKIGSFGAVRPYKNHITAAAAAIAISKILHVPVEFHMSSGGEGGILRAIEEMCADVPNFKLIKHGWAYWDDFIKIVGQMDLLMQVSFTESFNLVTADGVFMGVPTVVSSAINWAPDRWKVDSDDALAVAHKGIQLLYDGHTDIGVKAIERHNDCSVEHWLSYLENRTVRKVGYLEKFARCFLWWVKSKNLIAGVKREAR